MQVAFYLTYIIPRRTVLPLLGNYYSVIIELSLKQPFLPFVCWSFYQKNLVLIPSRRLQLGQKSTAVKLSTGDQKKKQLYWAMLAISATHFVYDMLEEASKSYVDTNKNDSNTPKNAFRSDYFFEIFFRILL